MLAKDLAPYLQAIEVLRNLELIDTKDRETARKNWHGAKLPCLDVLDLLEYYANLGLPSFPILVLSQH